MHKITTKTLNLLLDCHQSLKAPLINYTRCSLSHYTNLRLLARGSYGDVFTAFHKNQPFALKRISFATIKKHPNTALFQAERSCLLACRNSKYLLFLIKSFTDLHHLYFVTSFCPGGDLLSLMAKLNTLSLPFIRFYAAELLLAIEELHSLGYIHRDVKPDNVFLTCDGHVKLGDFGSCARLVDGLVFSDTPVGTPDYISKEVLVSVNAEVGYGPEVDVWSFGVVVYEMAVGVPCFYSESLTETYRRIESVEYEEKGDDEVKELVRACVVDREKRKSVSEVKRLKLFEKIDWVDLVPVYVPEQRWEENFLGSEVKEEEKEEEGMGEFVGFTYDEDVRIYDEDNDDYDVEYRESDKTLIKENDKNKDVEFEETKYKERVKSKVCDENDNYNIIRNEELDKSKIINNKQDLDNEQNNLYKNLLEKKEKENDCNKGIINSKIFKSIQEKIIKYSQNVTEEKSSKSKKIYNVKGLNESLEKLIIDDDKELAKKDFININKNYICKKCNNKTENIKQIEFIDKSYYNVNRTQDIINSFYRSHYIRNLKFKECLFRLQTDLDFVNSSTNQIQLELENLAHTNEYLKKEMRSRTLKLEQQQTIYLNNMKKEIRQKKMEIREIQAKLDFEILAKKKYIDEIKYLKEKLAKKEVNVYYEFKVRILENKIKQDCDVYIRNGKIEINSKTLRISETLNKIYVFDINDNELHFIKEKKRRLIVKVCVLTKERTLSVTSSVKSEDELLLELKKEKCILQGCERLINALDEKNKKKGEEHKRGCLERIKQIKRELMNREKTVKSEKENDTNKLNEKIDLTDNVEKLQIANDYKPGFIKYFDFSNHKFTKSTFPANTICYHCNNLFYGAINQGYECVECTMKVHFSCVTLIRESCELFVAMKSGKVLYLVMDTVEEKERFIKCF